MDCGVVDHTSANWIPCSAVHNEMVTQRKNATFVVEANIHIVDLVARLTGAQQMFTAVLDPLDWPSEPARQKRDQQIFRIDMPLDAKTAADVKRDATHTSFRKLKYGGRLAPYPMYHLSARPDRHRICSRIMQCDHSTAFHGHGGIAVMIKTSLQSVRRASQRAIDLAFTNGETTNQVGLKSVVNKRCIWS